MINLKQHTVILLFFCAILFTSCTGNATAIPNLVEGNSFTNQFLTLDSIPTELTETATLNPTWQSGPIWAFQYLIKDNNVIAVYSGDGLLVKWSVDAKDIVATYKLGVFGPKALQFSGNSSLLIGPTGHMIKTNEFTNHSVDYVTGI